MSESSQLRKPSFVNEMISGYLGGAAYILSGQPLDIVKVRMQSTGETSIRESLKHIWKNEGILAFWKGSFFPLTTVGISIALLFGINEDLKHRYQNILQKKSMNYWDLFLVGGSSGMLYATFICPVEHIKVRMQVQSNSATTVYTNSIDCFRKLYSEYGVRGLFKGLGPTLIREFLGCGGYFATYFYLKDRFKTDSKVMTMIYGGLSGIMAWNMTFWLDNYKSRIQSDNIANPKYRGFAGFTNLSFRQLSKGYFAGIIKSFPANAGTFLVYELVNKYLYGQDNK
jgi:solute carrier family 25 carnitine/acylcarnitine transporter 20/29